VHLQAVFAACPQLPLSLAHTFGSVASKGAGKFIEWTIDPMPVAGRTIQAGGVTGFMADLKGTQGK